MRSFIFLLASIASVLCAADCDNTRPANTFTALEELDRAGEARLHAALKQLASREGWSQGEWEAYTSALADDPAAVANEDRRSSLMAELFAVVGRTPIDCARIDQLEREILELEQHQWDAALRKVERRLARAGAS
jgi:hypothetical protein